MMAAKRTAAYRARKRMTQEGKDELRAKSCVYTQTYRMKKKKLELEGRKVSKMKKKHPAMTSAQKSRAYRARKRMTKEGTEELRARGRVYNKRHCLKKKMVGRANSNKQTNLRQSTTEKNKQPAMTNAERQAAYRARKRATEEGIKELRAKGRIYSEKHRKKKEVMQGANDLMNETFYEFDFETKEKSDLDIGQGAYCFDDKNEG